MSQAKEEQNRQSTKKTQTKTKCTDTIHFVCSEIIIKASKIDLI